MTNLQKVVLAGLAIVAVTVVVVFGGAVFLLLTSGGQESVSQPITGTPIPVTVATATATFTPSPPSLSTPTAQPTPTGTKVVVVTVLPSPTPTRANCINNITGFGGSGLLTDEQVQDYIRQSLPPEHLDNCRSIKFVDKVAAIQATPISGNFIPVYREIFVYAIESDQYGPEELMDTIIHEIGHNVHYNIRRNNFDLDVQWAGLYQQSQKTFTQNGLGFISDYARLNKFEDFAESYMAYVRLPALLKFNNLEKYEFMRLEVFYGQEFAP